MSTEDAAPTPAAGPTPESAAGPAPDAAPQPPPDVPGPLATTAFFTLLLGSVVALGLVLAPYTTDAVLALLFAVLGRGAFVRLTERLGGRRGLAAAIVCLAVVLGVAAPTAFLVTSLSVEAAAAFEASRETVSSEGLERALFGESALAVHLRRTAELLGVEYTPAAVKAAVGKLAGAVVGAIYAQVNAVVANVISAVFHFGLVIVLLFYLLIDGGRLRAFLSSLSPLPEEEEHLLLARFTEVGHAIVVGNGVGSVLQGVLGGLAMWAADLPSAILWGTVMAIAAFLPLVGVSVVAVPAALYLALHDRPLAAGVFAAFTLGQGFIVENVVKTKLIGDHMKMHTVLIFLSLLGGIGAFGLMGLLYGPLVVALFLTLAELYRERYRVRFLPRGAGAPPAQK